LGASFACEIDRIMFVDDNLTRQRRGRVRICESMGFGGVWHGRVQGRRLDLLQNHCGRVNSIAVVPAILSSLSLSVH
jgi:hypothetical protein